ncbi:MAG: penicillin-binding transpeptidase domain-containing protein [Candidatus Latescibacterota bacterium]
MQTGQHITRQAFVMVIMAVMWMILAAKIGVIQFAKHDILRSRAISQSSQQEKVKANRGRILDRNGVQMAISMTTASYGMWPKKIANPESTIRILADAGGLSQAVINRGFSSGEKYVYLIKHADAATMQKMDCAIEEVTKIDKAIAKKNKQKKMIPQCFEKVTVSKRYYPLGKIGAQAIGYTDIDNRGIEGCELFFDNELSGRDGRARQMKDADGKSESFIAEPIVNVHDGMDMVLTIDWRIQEIAEEELEAGVETAKAKAGYVIVLDSDTGEILALANVPRFNPNDPASFNSGDPNARRNRLVTDMLEPGSTFKIVAFTEALESGAIKESDMVNCENGQYRIGSHIVHDSHKLGTVTAREVLIHSSNIGTIKVAEKIGKQKLYERARLFGFGQVTGSDFVNETNGRLPNPQTWSNLSLPTIAFGQGVAVSPLQLTTAYASIVNGGELLSPRIVKEFVSSDGSVKKCSEIRHVRRVMTPETASRVKEILCSVVEEGTGRSAAIPNIRLGGKTGTAQRTQEGGKGYVKGQYVSSFIGFIADRNPRLVCLVMVDSPVGVYYGSQVAAPVFKNIINRIINMGGSPLNQTLASASTASMTTHKEKNRNTAKLTAKFPGDTKNSSNVSVNAGKINPYAPTPAKSNPGVDKNLAKHSFTFVRGDSVMVPNITGKPLRLAVQNLVQANLKVKINGSGVVQSQDPLPGSMVAYGTMCEIACRNR